VASAAVALDFGMVEFKGIASNVAAFEASAPHTGSHSFDRA
jgi:hypothetical protein